MTESILGHIESEGSSLQPNVLEPDFLNAREGGYEGIFTSRCHLQTRYSPGPVPL